MPIILIDPPPSEVGRNALLREREGAGGRWGIRVFYGKACKTEGERDMRGKGLSRGMRAASLPILLLWTGFLDLQAQESPDSLLNPDSIPAQPVFQPPVYAVLGFGYGIRNDGCVLCESPEEDKSFSAYLGVVRPLWKGVGIGLDVSVWRRGRPGTPGPPDGEGIPEPTSLANMLGNLSVSFSYDFWHLFVRAGGGVAFGSKDLEMENPEGAIIVHTASGWGPGFSAGAGVTVPIASVVSLAFYGNWNMGRYDMVSPQGLIERGAEHQYLEFGVGVAMR